MFITRLHSGTDMHNLKNGFFKINLFWVQNYHKLYFLDDEDQGLKMQQTKNLTL